MKKVMVLGLLFFASATAFAQTMTISGTVTDDKNNPVPFAFIKDAAHNYATFSGPDGTFSIDADPSSRLMATCNNYQESLVPINNQPAVKIVMKAGGSTGTKKAASENDVFNIHEEMTDRSARPMTHFGTAQEELHGSPFFYQEWVHGYGVTPADSITENDNYLFNYEKLTGALLYTADGNTMYAVNPSQIKGFTLFDKNGQKVSFESVPAIDNKHYLQVLASGSKYKIYKQLNTKFEKADFQTNGITSTGNNYDSYVDDADYYIVKVPGGQPVKISLKRKSIRNAFGADANKANTYMSAHDSDEVDETFLTNLGVYMNN